MWKDTGDTYSCHPNEGAMYQLRDDEYKSMMYILINVSHLQKVKKKIPTLDIYEKLCLDPLHKNQIKWIEVYSCTVTKWGNCKTTFT